MTTPAAAHPHLAHPKYRSDIDGLRAVAVLSVLGFHGFPNWVPGGFIGVDIFFVISGYLISTIIFASLHGEGFSYREFYARRIRRIFPALLLVIAATLAFGWYALLPHEWQQLGKHVAAGAGFVSNFAFWNEAGYFDSAAETKPLLHLWSLAIEEQFYIVWPLLLGFAWRRRWRIALVIGVVALLSLAVNLATVHNHPSAAFYSPASRAWELLLGAGLAWLRLRQAHAFSRHRDLQAGAGLGLILLGLLLVRSHHAFPGGWALLPTVGAVLCIAAGPQAWLNRHVLGSRPMVWFGLISYPLYLWHWPLLTYARILEDGTPNRRIRALALLIATLLAWLTYRFVERHARHSERRSVVPLLAGAMVVLALLGVLAATARLPARHSDPYISQVAAAVRDWGYPDGLTSETVRGERTWRIGTGGGQVLLFGDSHIEQYGPRAVELGRTVPKQLNTLHFATWGGCPPIPGVFEDRNVRCDARRNAMIQYALGSEIDAVVVGGCWNCYFIAQAQPNAALREDEGYYYQDGQVKHRFRGGDGVERSLASLEALLRLLSVQKKVYLLLDNPVGPDFGPEKLLSGSRMGQMSVGRMSPTAPLPAAQVALNERLRALATRAGASVIDPLPNLCRADQCIRTLPDGTPIYKDSDHLRAGYMRRFGNWLDVALIRPQ
ncbi:acyltransferase family protein [Variovorax sp. J22G21]|uniref:acyltransferase family protein n=1 Tax=Variovorax fucosicus TaxID=3053517 RepID=UPI00257505BA|nr:MULTISPECIES: acyltransferase family protein [unclassified Variovorax]MDM0041441.1 acyltransferase family protein [Variovorax sp. J22R193]MDM0060497.1 acyltransferase family protein [Variovorax sp. J22G21]